MANLSFTKTFVDGAVLPASDLNTLQSDVSTYINARNGGGTAWDGLSSSSSSNIPLTLNNSSGTQDICRMQDNGSNVFQMFDGGILSLSSQSSCRVYRGTSDQTITTGAAQIIQYNFAEYDIKSEFDIVTNYRFTATKAGIYAVLAVVPCQGAAGTACTLTLSKNNIASDRVASLVLQGTTNETVVLSTTIQLAASDYIVLKAGAAPSNWILTASSQFGGLAIHKLS